MLYFLCYLNKCKCLGFLLFILSCITSAFIKLVIGFGGGVFLKKGLDFVLSNFFIKDPSDNDERRDTSK